MIFPALMAALITVGGGLPADEGGKLDFKVDLGDPPPCSTGFIPPPQIRSPADTTLRDLPTDLYCKTAQNDPAVVRGARNYPCQEFPGKRAPTVQLCRDPRGYVPIGTNPWRGPPVPYGTPMDHRGQSLRAARRNITPPNKFPYIPPGADYDPGPPVGAVAAGRAARARARAERAVPAAGAAERQRRRRRRGRTTRRRIRSCRRTAGPRPRRRRRPPQAVARRGACARCAGPDAPAPMPRRRRRRHRRPAVRRPPRTIRRPVCSPTPPGGTGVLRRRYGQGRARGDVGRPDDGSEAGCK